MTNPAYDAYDQAKNLMRRRALAPDDIAMASGAKWEERRDRVEGDEDTGVFRLEYFGHSCEVGFPGGEVRCSRSDLSVWDKIVVVRYLANAQGVPRRNRWISFPEISGGESHWRLVQKEVLVPLARRYGGPDDYEADHGSNSDHGANPDERNARRKEFFDIVGAVGGRPGSFGDVSAEFDVLPRVTLGLVIWAGDEEFPPSANLLFDESVRSYLEMADAYFVARRVAREFGIEVEG